MQDECCICGLPSPDGFDHEECFEEGSRETDPDQVSV